MTEGVENPPRAELRIGENSGKDYVSLALAAPEFEPREPRANLDRATGQDKQASTTVASNRD
jgi:uncharacterized protein (DUF736 family)